MKIETAEVLLHVILCSISFLAGTYVGLEWARLDLERIIEQEKRSIRP